jgi:predicted Zn-dependent protease
MTIARNARLMPRIALAAMMVLASTFALPAQAQKRGVSVVRDAEIEALVRDYASPILDAAGLGQSGIEIVLVGEDSFNAFVARRRIFINTGALMTAQTPGEIIGVIAHEAGHIAGGHQQRLREQLARANTIAVVSTLLGAGAAVAGSMTGTPGLTQGGTGLFLGGPEMARRSILSYQRTEEATADRAAVTYLERAGQSAHGMLVTFERFADDLALSGTRADPYQLSHPMPRERIANLQELVRESRFSDRRDPPALQQRHDLMRAKIAAYTQGHAAAMRLFRDDPRGLPALYADAIGTFLSGNGREALRKIDALVRANPNNAYFHEMRGEILMRANQPADAAKAYAQAMKLDRSRSGIIQVAHGNALLQTGQADQVRKATVEIQAGLTRARDYGAGYRYLAQAHAQLGEIAEADLATAEGHFHSGNYKDAKIFAARAQQRLAQGSPAWLRAQDIINYRQPGRG